MKQFHKRLLGLLLLVVVILCADQGLKYWVKTSFYLGEAYKITDWFYLLFTENKGMAFGLSFIQTEFLAFFRLLAIVFLGYYIVKQIKEERPLGFLICLSLIFAGAVGNILDNCFYGLMFSESTFSQLATRVPFGEGYSHFLKGNVVDMFYFPLIETTWPSWTPYAGKSFVFFSPIFNFADASISCGAIALLLFYYKKIFYIENKQ